MMAPGAGRPLKGKYGQKLKIKSTPSDLSSYFFSFGHVKIGQLPVFFVTPSKNFHPVPSLQWLNPPLNKSNNLTDFEVNNFRILEKH